MVSEELTTSCTACRSRDIEQVESLNVQSLADAWAQARSHGKEIADEVVRTYVLADVGATELGFWRCETCGLEFAHPMRSWSQEHYPHETHGLGFDHHQALAELAGMRPMKVLDIGCADGQFLERVASMGHEVMGIDLSQQDVFSARKLGVKAEVADFREVTDVISNGQKFDLITMFQVIEHLDEPDVVFTQIGEIAAPGALLLVGCPSHLRYTRVYKHPQRLQRSDFWDYPPHHLLRWTPQALKAFLLRHGWQTETFKCEPLPVLGGAAHMTALQGLSSGWYRDPWQRRFVTVWWMLRLVGARLLDRSTGVRLFVRARRLTQRPQGCGQ